MRNVIIIMMPAQFHKSFKIELEVKIQLVLQYIKSWKAKEEDGSKWSGVLKVKEDKFKTGIF